MWERAYWLDGLLPLAYITENKKLIDKVQPWIEWTLASQQPNGYFGPIPTDPMNRGCKEATHDWWPKMVMLK